MSGAQSPAGRPSFFFRLLFGIDPFPAACIEAEMPADLSGRFDPPVWKRLEERFGKATDAWQLEDWQRAARILGLMISHIEETERIQKFVSSIPKRRGPRPKPSEPWGGPGLLGGHPPTTPRTPGRPRKWTQNKLDALWLTAEFIRKKLQAEGRRGTDKEVLDRMINLAWERERQANQRLGSYRKVDISRKYLGPWRNALKRFKKRRSK